MDFFQQQAKVRRRSHWLVLLFLLAVAGIIAAIDLVVAAALIFGSDKPGALPPLGAVLIPTSVGVLVVIALASIYRMARLGGGGATIARELGATLVPPDTQDPRQRRLRNVVEEMAIAAGVPVPQIFVLEQESGINAFAAGYSPSDAAVTVTRGALDKLSRDELQGVIGHEFSHILNGDMRLNIRLIGLLFGILLLGIVGRKVLFWGGNSDSRRSGFAILLAALGVMIIGYIGVFFGRLIKAGISRQREYLADASAVQFTRQSAGIAGALKKVSGLNLGSRLTHADGEEVAHMLFGDGVGYSTLFATHPPLYKRIQALDPDFNALQFEQFVQTQNWNDPDYVADDEARPVLSDLAGGGTVTAPTALAATVGRPQSLHYDCAAALHRALPTVLLEAARDAEHAIDVIFGLLLEQNPDLRDKQLQTVEKHYGQARRAAVESLYPTLAGLDPAQRLPLAAIAFPSLRRQPREKLIQLIMIVAALFHGGSHLSVFEYCLGRLMRQQLAETLRPGSAKVVGRRRLDQCAAQVQCLLSVVAGFGQDDTTSARAAYLAGMQALPLRQNLPYQPPDPEGWATALDQALRDLDQLVPPAKALLLEALLATIAADGKLTVEEAELLRAVCAGLHCPLPPVLQEAA
jgi:Zn-dependent protease with chaperone function